MVGWRVGGLESYSELFIAQLKPRHVLHSPALICLLGFVLTCFSSPCSLSALFAPEPKKLKVPTSIFH